MTLVDSSTCFIYLSSFVKFLVISGAILLYVLLGLITYLIARKVDGELFDKNTLVYTVLAWPVILIFGLMYWLYRLIILPIVAATKEDLSNTERRLTDEINSRCPAPRVVQPSGFRTAFKVGDLITAKRGNPGDYKHLNEGCVCRVKTIDSEGRMTVMLVDHKDFDEQVDSIGKEFKAPARNFVLIRKPKNKNKRRSH